MATYSPAATAAGALPPYTASLPPQKPPPSYKEATAKSQPLQQTQLLEGVPRPRVLSSKANGCNGTARCFCVTGLVCCVVAAGSAGLLGLTAHLSSVPLFTQNLSTGAFFGQCLGSSGVAIFGCSGGASLGYSAKVAASKPRTNYDDI